MQAQIDQLTTRVTQLENLLKGRSTSFDEMIRNIVFFANDTGSLPNSTTVVTGVDFVHSTVTTATVQTGTPVTFLKLYYRGKAYHLPVYA